jgi:hypothetical protein
LIGWEGKIVSKYLPIVCLALFIFGCGQDESSIIPETHPAYEFYQIAKSGPTTLNVCESYGGKEIYPNDYDVIETPAQGVAIIKQKSTGDSFLGVSFGEGGIVVTVKMCCWPK